MMFVMDPIPVFEADEVYMERSFRFDIMPEIKDRWSARAFSSQPVTRDDLMALIEAASFAPSSFNEQPWRYIIADDEPTLQKMRGILTEFVENIRELLRKEGKRETFDFLSSSSS